MSCNCPKIYAKRDVIGQREHYTRHICHMTYEGLHDKSDIAAELAHRDKRIEELETDSKDGWDKYRELRQEVAKDKYPSLTNDVILDIPYDRIDGGELDLYGKGEPKTIDELRVSVMIAEIKRLHIFEGCKLVEAFGGDYESPDDFVSASELYTILKKYAGEDES